MNQNKKLKKKDFDPPRESTSANQNESIRSDH